MRKLAPLVASAALLISSTYADEADRNDSAPPVSFEPIVITAPAMNKPLEVSFNPKAAQQPLPANDGASILKSIPGVSVIRKGGTDGDPVFRGMAASRLNILFDDEQILGGCGGRMDPPTAYIFPDSFDRVTLIKGPQSVRYGHGSSAGTVLFERAPTYFLQAGGEASASIMAASFNRLDYFLDAKAGTNLGYARGIVTYAKSDDYKDGGGKNVHSKYERQSASAIVGFTPDPNTRIELSTVKSDAIAAYADRGMDGSLFKRENYALKFEKEAIGSTLDKLEANAYYNYIDHVMDNYTLRDGAAMDMASNPDRKTIGGRITATLLPSDSLKAVIGADAQYNRHTARSSMADMMGRGGRDYAEKTRNEDFYFSQYGVFSELAWNVSDENSLVFGLRGDLWKARDSRVNSLKNPDGDADRSKALTSAFARYERDFGDGSFYIGLGYTERAPDFWEVNKEGAGETNATSQYVFKSIEPEKTAQLDIGAMAKLGDLEGFVSAFYGKIDDYILIQTNYRKPTRGALTIARNIDATTYGGEAGLAYRFFDDFKATASLAYTRGENDTDSRALGQIPPFESRFILDWDNGSWTFGALARFVASQNRYAPNEGNIVGQDLGKGESFNVFSINGGYRWGKAASLLFGVDNLLDKTYAEFISKSGASVQGYDQTIRVNEPGRVVWAQARFSF